MSMNEPPKDEAQDRFEQQLRGFRPVAPRALTIPSRRVPWGGLAVAAAAVLLVIAVQVVLKHSRHSGNESVVARATQTVDPHGQVVAPSMTLAKLNAALRTSDHDLNQMLDDASPRLLPREHRGTALFELGKE
jgi:hypothetical protein